MSVGPASPGDLATGAWLLDPARSSVEFQVPNFWGLTKVKGHFERYEGRLDLRATPAVQLMIDAASLQTGNRRRDEHLRSSDFFDVEHHPHVRFTSETAQLDGQTLAARGTLGAAGRSVPVELRATLTFLDGEPVIETETAVDRRDLGMTWNRLGAVGTLSTLLVKGNLVRGTPEWAPDFRSPAVRLAGARLGPGSPCARACGPSNSPRVGRAAGTAAALPRNLVGVAAAHPGLIAAC